MISIVTCKMVNSKVMAFVSSDVNKDLTFKDKDQTYKDKDKD